jgi:uncharacterized membrane protein (UPF0127 family)
MWGRRAAAVGTRLILSLLLLVSTLNACAETGQKGLPLQELTIQKADGSTVSVLAEIASTEEQRATGLMHRKHLDEGKGMLFVFTADQIMAFWMKNTLIPLSIAYIASDGSIREIHNMQAQSLDTVNSSRSCRYALEVPQGWFERTGINVGDVLKYP